MTASAVAAAVSIAIHAYVVHYNALQLRSHKHAIAHATRSRLGGRQLNFQRIGMVKRVFGQDYF